MKKILSILFSAAMSASALTNNVNAQVADKNYLAYADKLKVYLANFEEKSNESAAASNKDDVKAAKANLKALKANLKALKANNRAAEDFKREFKDAGNVSWTVENNAIVGSFFKDDIRTNVVYNKNGRRIHSLMYCTEKNIPETIKSTVANTYPGYNVTLSVEVHEAGLIFHIVQIENETTYKQIGVYNGDVNEIQEYIKAK